MSRCIIICASPYNQPEFIKAEIRTDDYIICADGGYDIAKKAEITPDIVIGDFDIRFVNCDHGTGAPDAVGVVVNVDGKTIYEAGDTCLRLDRTDEIPHPLDILIAPINGAYGNLNEKDCSLLASVLKPKITIPCHYGMFASHHGDPGKFYEIMTANNLPFYILQQGEEYRL